MKISVGIPTCREGLNVPTGFAGPEDIVRMTQQAERLGFFAVWGNDHLTVPTEMRARIAGIANFYEPLIMLAHLSAVTQTIRLGTGVIVYPLRQSYALAKQAATLDVLSQGRLLLGVGIGSLREEFEMVQRPGSKPNRGDMLDEGLQVISRLFTEDNVNFQGTYNHLKDIQIYPKPQQNPFPIYIAGNHPNTAERVVKWGRGWLISSPSLDAVRQSGAVLRSAAERLGRDPASVEIVAIQTLSVAKTHEEAVTRLKNSRIARRHAEQDLTSMVDANLVGTPDEIAERIARFEDAGVSQITAQNFACDTFSEMLDLMQILGEQVVRRV